MHGRNHKRVPGKPEWESKQSRMLRLLTDSTPRNKDTKFADYPCSVYLHNALWFISEGKSNAAYEEICWAILKSGGKLTDDERKKFDEISSRRRKE